MKVSVCTLAHGRQEHLTRLVEGLGQSEAAPTELVIAVMQDDPYVLPKTAFPVRQLMLGSTGIPLAKARNAAARAAGEEFLVFLDVDCIPNPALIGDYLAASRDVPGLLMGEVAYLPKSEAHADLDFVRFDSIGVKHSERAGAPAGRTRRCEDYRCFWSLNFALSAADFRKAGGFDESFEGYGGEDTDFGRSVAAAGIPINWVRGAKAYHQYHPHHMPPVHHIDSVVANAHRFRDKWGEPTMQHWLRAFVLMGLVKRRGNGWVKLREPNAADLALTRQQEDEPYASSASVLEQLERDASRAAPSKAA